MNTSASQCFSFKLVAKVILIKAPWNEQPQVTDFFFLFFKKKNLKGEICLPYSLLQTLGSLNILFMMAQVFVFKHMKI